MAALIVKRDLILCDNSMQYEGGKIDLEGAFSEVRPFLPYPYRIDICVVSQVVNGKGKLPFYLDFRYSLTRELVRTTHSRQFHFSSPKSIVTIVFRVEGLILHKPGMYSVELFCNNDVIGDTNFWAHPAKSMEP